MQKARPSSICSHFQCWEGGDRGIPGAHRPTSLALSSSPDPGERSCLKTHDSQLAFPRTTPKVNLGTSGLHTHVNTHTCTRVQTHIHTQKRKEGRKKERKVWKNIFLTLKLNSSLQLMMKNTCILFAFQGSVSSSQPPFVQMPGETFNSTSSLLTFQWQQHLWFVFQGGEPPNSELCTRHASYIPS